MTETIGKVFSLIGIISVIMLEIGNIMIAAFNNFTFSIIGIILGIISIAELIYYFINMEKDK